MYTNRGNKYLIKENKLRIPDTFMIYLQESFTPTPPHCFELIKTKFTNSKPRSGEGVKLWFFVHD